MVGAWAGSRAVLFSIAAGALLACGQGSQTAPFENYAMRNGSTGSSSSGGDSTDGGTFSYETGDVGEGACCAANGTPGCDDEVCEADVCAVDEYCCADNWDGLCALTAVLICDACDTIDSGGSGEGTAGGTGAGDTTGGGLDESCCEWHASPGCDDESCEAQVCLDDAFCCDTIWDALCVEAALDGCSICGGGGTGGDDGDDDGDSTTGDSSDSTSSSSTTGGGCPYAPDSVVEEKITVGDKEREYVLWIGKDATFPAPTAFAWHGWGGGPYDAGPRLKPKVHWKDAIVVAPKGLNRKFEGLSGERPGFQAHKGELDDRDLKLYDAIYKDLKDKKCLDPDEVYSTGFSNGGLVTHVIACHRGKQIAAAAPGGAAGPKKTPCQDKVPILISHGRKDELLPLAGAKGSWRTWKKTNGCAMTGDIPADGCQTAPGCPAKEPVRFCNFDIGHSWPDGRAKRVADFMRAYKKSD